MYSRRLLSAKYTVFFILTLMLLSACSQWNLFNSKEKMIEEAQELTWMSENFPPYNYGETGQMSGVAIEVLEAIFDKTGIPLSGADVSLEDWSTAYQKIVDEKGTALFSMVRNEEREDLFKWVGPIAPHKEVIIAHSGSGIKIFEDADLNRYFFGVVEGYPSKTLLRNKGVDEGNIIEYPTVKSLYQALFDYEIQCISYSEQASNLIISSMGEDPENFSAVYTVQVDQLYYAFNQSVSDGLISMLQEALDELSNDKAEDGSSTMEKILDKYTIILHAEDVIPDEDVISLVNQTAADLETNYELTIQKMNNREAPYLDADNPSLYSFAYDLELTIVAHAANASIVGVNFKGKPDASGKLFRDEILEGATENGSGWVNYIYTRPDQSGLYLKTTYYQLITASDGHAYIVCSGKYK